MKLNEAGTMLCDIHLKGNRTDIIRLRKGIYETKYFDLSYKTTDDIDKYPDLSEVEFYSYGVCDSYKQVIEQCPVLETSVRQFVISVTPIDKADEPERGGWRWDKWGPYIGEHEPTHEYLYDEPEIDEVWCFSIYEIK